jgi:glutamine synthetase
MTPALDSLYLNKREILKKSQDYFKNSSSLILKIGCELEFFLLQKNGQTIANQDQISDLILSLKAQLEKRFSLISQVEKEQGVSQVEVKTHFTSDLTKLCEEIADAKIFIKKFATEKNLIASFAAQPFFDDCGNALQFNISLHEGENGANLFSSNSNLLKKIAQELLNKTNEMMVFLAPKPEDYSRYLLEVNRALFRAGKFTAPTNLSFGANNRTCAVRVANGESGKRLEYRVASAEADQFLVIAEILLAVISGLQVKNSNQKQIHGNAFDEQYCLPKLCQNFDEALEFFLKSKKL